jgi:hypothetical protein
MTRKAAKALIILSFAASAWGADTVSFNRDIRPIMSDTCFRCHGPDKSSRMADLRLDLRDAATKKTDSGVTPIVPGKPEESEIVRRIFSTDPAEMMPPDYSHKVLTQKQKETIRQWVAEGAQYEGHWSFQPVQRPTVPAVENGGAPIRNPIDSFIQARLLQVGLKPSHEADRPTLIRRVTLDLTGLPPRAEDVAAFVKDTSPDAYEKVVDRLLSSPAYAEKQATFWLDAVRYADTRGFHNDIAQPAWPYRDYVLKSFRDNKPFDEFTREQFAGDLMPNPTIDQKVATAFNRVLRTSEEGGIQDKEYLAKYGADRVRTVAAVWLGLTMGCAECHDHKFDPIKTKDFYAMKSFFADIKENGILSSGGAEPYSVTLQLPTEAQARRAEQLKAEITAAEKALDDKTTLLAGAQAAWEQSLLAEQAAGLLKWTYQRPVSAHSQNGTKLTIYNDEKILSNRYIIPKGAASLRETFEAGNGLVVASGPNPDNETFTITLKPGPGTWTALALKAMQDESLPGGRQSRGADRFLLTEVGAELVHPGKALGRKLGFKLATYAGVNAFPENPPIAAIDGNPLTGWGGTAAEGTSPVLALRFANPVTTDAESLLTVQLHFNSQLRRAVIGRVRLALGSGEYAWPELGDDAIDSGIEPDASRLLLGGVIDGVPKIVLDALQVAPDTRTEAQAKAVREHFQWSNAGTLAELTEVQRLKYEQAVLNAEIPRVMITQAVEPRETRILARGNWMDDSGEVVQPAIPGFLGTVDTGGRRATRLDLANWLVSKDNPMTARVFVNRQWRALFGIGISKGLDDFGSQGEWPTHLELLDWLASEFMQPAWQAEGTHPWDIKHIVRTIVTSHTYRQTSMSTPELDERDMDNRLLARQSRIRVEAEAVRDIALAVSGLLSPKFGGPSVNPRQPDGYLAAMNFPKRDYSRSHGEDLYRRGLYTYWRRTFLLPSLVAFDASAREECTVNRANSNTPLQALVLLNDPVFVEAARVFAQNIVAQGGPTLSARIDWAFMQALGRKPTVAERKILADLYHQSTVDFSKSPTKARELINVGDTPPPKTAAPVRLAAMTTVARAILNLHETITRN